jgi:hypothetical protein
MARKNPKKPWKTRPEVKRFTSSAEPHVTIASLGDSVFDLCEEGDLNPPVLVKNLRILAAKRAKTGKNGQEVDPGGPRLASGNE